MILNYKILTLNEEVETWETVLKLAKRWRYEAKSEPDDKTKFITVSGCFEIKNYR